MSTPRHPRELCRGLGRYAFEQTDRLGHRSHAATPLSFRLLSRFRRLRRIRGIFGVTAVLGPRMLTNFSLPDWIQGCDN
jgi:hypothetical protein